MKKKLIHGLSHDLGIVHKIWLTMRLIVILFFVSLMHVSASVYSQKTKLSIKVENATLQQLFDLIQDQSEFDFFYKNEQIPADARVSIDAKNETIEAILNDALKDTGLKFGLVDKDIVIIPSEPADGHQQRKTVSGKVTDSSGATLPGVSVVVKGTTNGVITDNNGNYLLSNVHENATLQLSFVGMKSLEVLVGTQNSINIVLEDETIGIEEVVAIGYGTSKRKDLTGSISSVKSADLQGIVSISAESMLQGKAAGVQVVQNSGSPGADVFVRVRGSGSLMGESRPLYVVDGIPMNNLTSQFIDGGGQLSSGISNINPNDIETIEILKDAASTAIYGSRGSNGVILITTKKGKSGNAKFTFDSSYGIQSIPKRHDMINGAQFVELIKEELVNVNRNPNVFPYNQMVVSEKSTNWQDEIFQNAPVSNYNFAVTGGNDKISTFISLGYYNQEGTIIEQRYQRYSGRLNLDYQATKKLKFGLNISISNANSKKVPNDYSTYSVLGNALLIDPNVQVYNSDGTYGKDVLLARENPVLLAKEITYNNHQKRLLANMYAEYNIAKGFKFKTTFGLDDAGTREERFIPSFVLFRKGIAEATALNQEVTTIVNENILSYFTKIKDHSISLLGGISFQESNSSWLTTGGQIAGSDIVTTIAITSPYIPGHTLSSWGLLSYLGRVNYNYKDKYLADASFRIDGSSRFGENKRYGTFPSLSLAWRISGEPFMQGLDWITDLKLRSSVGVTGNQDGLPDFPSLALYSSGRNYDGLPGISLNNIANVDLGWESTLQTNFGIDFTLFKGRLTLYADYYNKNTTDLIFPRDIPWHTGFSRIERVNLGNMQNRGFEFSLSTKNLTEAFKWSTDFNISFNKNKITSLPDNGPSGSDYIYEANDSFGAEGPYLIYRVGESIGSFYGFKYKGVYASDSDVPRTPVDAAGKNLYDKGVRGGDAIFEDINQDGSILRANDRVIIGNALPIHTGGITNNFSYKNFDLSVFMNWSYGNQIYNMTSAVLQAMASENNQTVNVLDRWKTQGQVTNIPRAWYGASSVGGAANTDVSSRFLEDGSFLRLRTVTFGYNFSKSLIDKIHLNSLRVYVSGQNLWTYTNYSGFDPESQNLGNSITQPTLGVDYLTQPLPRIIMFGLNLGF